MADDVDLITELDRVRAMPANARRKMAQGRALGKLAVEIQEHLGDLTDSQQGMPKDTDLDHCLADLRLMVTRLARLGAERERGLT